MGRCGLIHGSDHGLAASYSLATGPFSGRSLDLVEGRGLARQRIVLQPFPRAMVRHGKEGTGGGAHRVLVAQPGGFAGAALLCRVFPARFGLHLRLRLYLDSLHPQSHNSSPPCGSAPELPGVRTHLPAEIQLLPRLRCAARAWGKCVFAGARSVQGKTSRRLGKNYFLGGACCGAWAKKPLYLSVIGLKSGWVRSYSFNRRQSSSPHGILTVWKSSTDF